MRTIKINADKFKKNAVAWLIMLPSLILFTFYVWEPLLESIRLSLYHAKGTRLQEFVGFQNYLVVFQHPDFFPAIRNTFLYTFWSLLIGFIMPILMAVLITETAHLKSFFRVGVYFPNIMPGIATVLIWGYLFRPGKTGVLNILLSWLGAPPLDWLSNPAWTIPLMVATMTWKAAGSTALIYAAGVESINPELYEAAAIDGARIWERIRYVTLPEIFGLGKTLLILQIIAVFQILYEPLVMTNGGPNNASLSIMQLVFRYAFEDFNYPMAASLSVIISVILMVLTAVYFKLTKANSDHN